MASLASPEATGEKMGGMVRKIFCTKSICWAYPGFHCWRRKDIGTPERKYEVWSMNQSGGGAGDPADMHACRSVWVLESEIPKNLRTRIVGR